MNYDPQKKFIVFVAVLTLSLMILGAGGAYVLFELRGEATPAGILLLLGMAAQQIAQLIMGVMNRQNTENIRNDANGKLNRIEDKIDEVKNNGLNGNR